MSLKPSICLPVNPVSFGNVGYNLLLALNKLGQDFDYLPIGPIDFSPFNKSTQEFRNLIGQKATDFHKSFSRKSSGIRLWHLNGSEQTISEKQHLFTFHETDSLTPAEVNIANSQEKIFVSSRESKEVFESFGVTRPVIYCPLGVDTENFYPTGKKYLDNSVCCWYINAKYEKVRKSHDQLIRCWLAKYGNNRSHRLHLSIWNPFFSVDQNNAVAANLMAGREYSNVQFFGYSKTLGELNDAMNCANIVCDLSGGEGWSLGSFHTMSMGKHGLIHNCSAMKDWANAENATLVEPSCKKPVYDGIFFHEGQPFNQGNIYGFDDEALNKGFDEVYSKYRVNPVNTPGLKLREDFTWQKTAQIILDNLV